MKSVLIVGGSKGLGRSLASYFVEKNYRIFSIGLEPLEPLSEESKHFVVDICDGQALRSCLDKITIPIDGVILCQRYRGDDRLQGEIDTSLIATVNIIEHLEPRFEKNPVSLVLVGSVLSDFVSLEMDVSYHICKAALKQMARYYSVKLGKKAMVNCLQLGTFAKSETEEFFAQDMENFKSLSPQGALMHCRDLGQIFHFLIDQKPWFLTGQSFTVDGGITSQWIESFEKAKWGQ